MNTFNLCLFSLFILGALTQVKGEQQVSKLDQTIEDTANIIANQVGSIIRAKRTSVLKRLETEIKSLTKQPGYCASHKVKKIVSLRSEYKAADTCTLVEDVVGSVRIVLVNGTHIVLDVIGNTVNVVTGSIACILTHPVGVSCIFDQAKKLIEDLIDTVPKIVSFVIQTLESIVAIIGSAIECIHLQTHTEKKFNAILASACP